MGRIAGGKNALSHGYFIQNSKANLIVRICDRLLSLLIFCRKKPLRKDPSKILIVQPNHLGDVVIATAILKPLKKLYPNAKISFLIGSWSQKVIERDPRIDKVHFFDHFRLNRSKDSRAQKLWRHISSFVNATLKLRKEKYDMGLILSPYWANGIPLTFVSKIRYRIGFKTGGFAPLLNQALSFEEDWHISRGFKALLDHISKQDVEASFKPELKGVSADLIPNELKGKNWIVIQVGAGDPEKKWSVEGWKELIKEFTSLDCTLVFTGYGDQEHLEIEAIIKGGSNCLNLANKLNWATYLSVVKQAQFFIGVESVGGHVASAFEIPTLLLVNSNLKAMKRFSPLNASFKMVYIKQLLDNEARNRFKSLIQGILTWVQEIKANRAVLSGWQPDS